MVDQFFPQLQLIGTIRSSNFPSSKRLLFFDDEPVSY